MAQLPDGIKVDHGIDGEATITVRLGSAPLEIIPVALQAAQAVVEEAFAAAAEGQSIVWLVARVPADIPREERQELVRRAAAELADWRGEGLT